MSELDRKSLEEEFDLKESALIEITNFKTALKEAKKIEDPSNALTTIIEKAGSFLDLIETEMRNGAMSARYMEVANQMLNTILAASGGLANINSTTFNDQLKGYKTAQKNRELDQKDKELEIKRLAIENKPKGDKEGTTTNNNIIFTDRETMLKMLKNKNQNLLTD
jgi:hypothetical protein